MWGMIRNLNLAFSIFGIAYAAFFVWLMVRIINRREKWAMKLAIYSGIAFGILAFTTPFVVILYLDMVSRQHPTTEECLLLFGVPFTILSFLFGTVLYRTVDRRSKGLIAQWKRNHERDPGDSGLP